MSTPEPGQHVRVEDAGQVEYVIPTAALAVLLDSFPEMRRKPQASDGADS